MAMENWIQTRSGIHFDVIEPRAEDLDIADIAHALSLKCRFNGHCEVFYSVAEHSVRVARILPPVMKLHGLLHDGAEAYLPDVPRPIKPLLVGFRMIEAGIERAILGKWEAVSLIHKSWQEVKCADNILLATEARDLMGDPQDWQLPEPPLAERIIPWSPAQAEYAFLYLFAMLSAERIAHGNPD